AAAAPAGVSTVAPVAVSGATPTSAPAAAPTAAAAPAAAAPASGGSAGKSDFGVDLPADAAPKAQEVTLHNASPSGLGWKNPDFNESVYSRGPAGVRDHFTEPLLRLDKNWQLVPGMASKWEVSKDGLSWTFTIDKGQMWSNGDEFTADDVIA